MKKPGKAIKKIDKKAPVKSKKEKTIVKQLSETFKISEDGFHNNRTVYVLQIRTSYLFSTNL